VVGQEEGLLVLHVGVGNWKGIAAETGKGAGGVGWFGEDVENSHSELYL